MGDLYLFLPETAVLFGALVAFALSVFDASAKTAWRASTFVAAIVVSVTASMLFEQGEPFFPKIYRVDLMSQLLKLGIGVGLFFTLLVSGNMGSYRPRARVDVPIFLFLSAVGMMLLVSATELLTIYVALELSAYGLYIIAVLNRRQREGSEAGAKYILFGAASSAVTLYGVSLIYGATGTTYLADIVAGGPSLLLVVGVLLALAGLLFKLAVFPFHSWAPDTYEGAPHQAATFIGTASKAAAVGVLIRVLAMADTDDVVTVLMVLSVASMTFGNLAAIVQKDIKRLLAYSTIAHAGYIVIGLLAFSDTGTASALFYVLTYIPIAFCAFLVVCAVGTDGHNPTLDSIAGLYKRAPMLTFALIVGMFGLAGIPPTPGFAGKWFLFSAAIQEGMFWIVLVAAINATVSLYYYLQVVKAAFLNPPGEREDVEVPFAYELATYLAVALILFTGFYPGPLWELCLDAAQALF